MNKSPENHAQSFKFRPVFMTPSEFSKEYMPKSKTHTSEKHW